MGDSDDEYDRKRRDKFRGERTESYRDGRRDDRRSRDDWDSRDWSNRQRSRPDYRDYRGGGGGRDRYSPSRSQDMGPPMKRMRNDWEDRSQRYGHDYYGGGGGVGAWDHYPVHPASHQYVNNLNSNNTSRETSGNFSNSNVETQPPMMTFKAFLVTQEDSITDEEAIKRYNEYKLDFRRQQLNEFFIAHKDEEWFKIKYHPEESVKRKEEQLSALKKRVEVFLDLLKSNEIDGVSIDGDQQDNLLLLLDAVVIKLEGGDEEDLKILKVKPKLNKDPPAKETKEAEVKAKEEVPEAKGTDEIEKKSEEDKKESAIEVSKEDQNGETAEETENKDSEKENFNEAADEKNDEQKEEPSEQTSDKVPENVESAENAEKPSKKRKRTSSDSSSSSKSSSGSVGSKEPGTPPIELLPKPEGEQNDTEMKDVKEDNHAEQKSDQPNSKIEESTKEDVEKPEENVTDKSPKKEPVIDLAVEEKETRALHKTSSIFLRNLAPTITKAEVEAMCKRFPGFLRVAIADPQPERRWFRRGWVSFKRNVNIKEICWSLNNIRLRDCELGAIVNRDLSRRIRSVNGVTCHKQVVRNDIKLSAKIIHNLDNKSGLWRNETNANPSNEENKKEMENKMEQETFGLASNNPVLNNITDYLIEEASAEEEELLGLSGDHEEGQVGSDADGIVERDPVLLKVLDKLILYLRIVHSVDYYNHCEYPNEDEMPNRCGIMHVRGPPPTNKVTTDEIMEYCKNFESKMNVFLASTSAVSDTDFEKLGAKSADAEVEKFIQANSQEISKDKWLCPLSGKKFKGPDFIRKHIFNKHAEKVAEVKAEAEYFNNYLKDPKRPQLPEHPGNKAAPKELPKENPGFASFNPSGFGGGYGGNFGNRGGFGGGGYNPGFVGGFGIPPRSNRGFNRGRGSGDFRPVIHYRDLDAPREPDEFL